jgi:hypothetical protein
MKTRNEKCYVPYHVNPAVIKSYLRQLPKDQLILHGRYIRRRALGAEPGSNQRRMFVLLYQYAQQLYKDKYKNAPR